MSRASTGTSTRCQRGSVTVASLLGPLLGARACADFGDAAAWRLGATLCAVAALLHATVTRRAEVGAR